MEDKGRKESHETPLDRVPQARPLVTAHDHLWAQMEMLNFDAQEAQRVQQNRGFLGSAHAEALMELRRLQIELAQAMTREEESSGIQQYRELWAVTDPEALRTRLFHDNHFELLDNSVARTAAKLDEIAALIDVSDLSVGTAEASNDRRAPNATPRFGSVSTDSDSHVATPDMMTPVETTPSPETPRQ